MLTPANIDAVKDALDQIIHVQAQQQLVQSANMQELLVRVKRMETRLVRLMEEHGLDEQGQSKARLMESPRG